MEMAANNRSGMRPTGRSPPFLAIGLTVALVILGFNYWTLSSRNSEQADEIAVLESEMRLMNAKKLSAEKRGETIQDKVKDLETELARHKSMVADKASQLSNLGAEKEALMNEKQKCEADNLACNNEKLPGCNKEKEDLQLELNKVKESLELEKNQPKNVECDQGKCTQFSDAAREKLLEDLKKHIGVAPLATLHKNGVNVGKFEKEAAAAVAQGEGPVEHPVAQGMQPLVPGALPVEKKVQDPQQPPQQPDLPQQGPNAVLNAVDMQQKIVDQQNLGAQPPAENKDVNAEAGKPGEAQIPRPLDHQGEDVRPMGDDLKGDENKFDDRIEAVDQWKHDDAQKDALDDDNADPDLDEDDVDEGDYDDEDEEDRDAPGAVDRDMDEDEDKEDEALRVELGDVADQVNELKDIERDDHNVEEMRENLAKDMQE